MPTLNLSNLNVILTILGLFITVYGFYSIRIKQVFYLGEALPAVIVGIALGQVGGRLIEPQNWYSAGLGDAEERQELQNSITLGLCRVVIGVQLVIAGFQLPPKYQLQRWKPMALLLIAAMTLMWLCTTGCIMATIPNLTFLAALVIGSCVTCTDPILSQAIAKGPFADKYVRRPLREIISSEAGANDGFGFPFLMLAVYLIRYAGGVEVIDEEGGHGLVRKAMNLVVRSGDVGRLEGGIVTAMQHWFVETWVYFILLSVVYGAVCGLLSQYAIRFALRKRWIDGESYLLWPTGLGLFLVGTCGLVGTDDLLACFVAGNAMNWNGEYLEETIARHDEVNSCVDVLLNFGGFMYIGAILPWSEFSNPETGLTYGKLIGLGIMVLLFRRIPAIFALYKLMPEVVVNWKDALFMGYFGPIGIGAVFYIEHTRHLFHPPDESETVEENNLTAVMVPVVYWLVFFSIVVHGLSIPILNVFLKWRGVKPIEDEHGPVEMDMLSHRSSIPKNSLRRMSHDRRPSMVVRNRFSRGPMDSVSIFNQYGPDERSWSRNVTPGEDMEPLDDDIAVVDGTEPYGRVHPFAEADADAGESNKQSANYIHIRIQQRNGRKTLTTVQGLPKKFDQKKILKVIKKKFACNGTIVNDTEMGEVIQLQGDQRKDVQEFLVDKKEGLELDAKTIKVHGF